MQALNLRAAEIALEMQTLEELELDDLGAHARTAGSTPPKQALQGCCVHDGPAVVHAGPAARTCC